jgi:hypothetical protein
VVWGERTLEHATAEVVEEERTPERTTAEVM